MKRRDGGFLAAVLRAGRGEDAADLADERAFHPQPAGLVEEVAHLAGHVAEARRRAEDDGVVVAQLVRRGDRRLLVELDAIGRRLLGGDGFGTRLIVTSVPATDRAPSATASAIVSMWPYIE